jgi:hypothetical protein
VYCGLRWLWKWSSGYQRCCSSLGRAYRAQQPAEWKERRVNPSADLCRQSCVGLQRYRGGKQRSFFCRSGLGRLHRSRFSHRRQAHRASGCFHRDQEIGWRKEAGPDPGPLCGTEAVCVRYVGGMKSAFGAYNRGMQSPSGDCLGSNYGGSENRKNLNEFT